eukprot:20372-Heterococcus_DN1.PRE.4
MVAAEIEQQRTLIVGAIQDGWVMGDDLVLPVTGAETVIEVQEMIKAKKGIGVTRMVLHKQDSPKPLEDRYYSWDLNRYCFVPDHVGQCCNCQHCFKLLYICQTRGEGVAVTRGIQQQCLSVSLYDGCVLEVHPNRANNWLWHPIAWYEAALLNSLVAGSTTMRRNIEVAYATHSISAKYTVQHSTLLYCPPNVIMQETTVCTRIRTSCSSNSLSSGSSVAAALLGSSTAQNRLLLSALEHDIAIPPPLRGHSLRAILRRFPDQVLLEQDIATGQCYASVNTHAQLPVCL